MDRNARRLVEDYCRTWDVETPETLIDEVFVTDVVDHNPQVGQADGIAGIRSVISLYRTAFPDLHVKAEDVIVEGDRGVLRWSAIGTHESDQLGMPAAHKPVHLTGIDIVRISDGRVAERWGEANVLE